MKENLQFSAKFFYAFNEAKLIETLSPQLRLLASSAFYFCNMHGNASVLAKLVQYEDLSIESEGLDALLLWILQGDISTAWKTYSGNYEYFIVNLPPKISTFYDTGNSLEIEEIIRKLREKVYILGTPEQLLLGDIISAVTKKKIDNASIRLLPQYTDINFDQWSPALSKLTFIKEFWPAQHLLGEKEVLKGKSAVIQMPTSAGKTKSTELILRSAFLAQRTNLAIIIAPFRALCHEIQDDLRVAFQDEKISIDALSDVLQNDFDISQILDFPEDPQILVVTPEKLLYVIRHHPDITSNLKLIIFDEGHQFDTGKRGITYELLLTSLKEFLPNETQKKLISAVVPNAEEISEWLNGDQTVVKGNNLLPTSKSVGFASWMDTLGQIKYIENGKDTFFVPRVIEKQQLQRRPRERKDRVFPENEGFSFKSVYSQLNYKKQLLESLESFLLAHWGDIEQNPEELAIGLVEKTLAFHLADDQKKKQLQELFILLTKNITNKIPEKDKKQIYGKTLLGIYTVQKIETWVMNNQKKIISNNRYVRFHKYNLSYVL